MTIPRKKYLLLVMVGLAPALITVADSATAKGQKQQLLTMLPDSPHGTGEAVSRRAEELYKPVKARFIRNTILVAQRDRTKRDSYISLSESVDRLNEVEFNGSVGKPSGTADTLQEFVEIEIENFLIGRLRNPMVRGEIVENGIPVKFADFVMEKAKKYSTDAWLDKNFVDLEDRHYLNEGVARQRMLNRKTNPEPLPDPQLTRELLQKQLQTWVNNPKDPLAINRVLFQTLPSADLPATATESPQERQQPSRTSLRFLNRFAS